MTIEKKNLELKLSSLAEDGTFEGLLSAYGNVDGGGDVVEKSAYTKWLKESGPNLVMCWHHDQKDPIGMLQVKDSEDGLHVTGKLNLDDAVPTAKRAYSMMKFLRANGLKMGMSIGYQTIKREFKDGIRYLKELKLIEGSLVTVPMNDLCWVDSVKGAQSAAAKDFMASLEAIQLWSTKYQMIQALTDSLDTVFYSDSGRQEKIAEVGTILGQFQDAYMEWLPKLLDLWGVKEFPSVDAKAGRAISAASRKRIEDAISNLKALLDDDATSEEEAGKSVKVAAKSSTEPGPEELHSVFAALSKFKL